MRCSYNNLSNKFNLKYSGIQVEKSHIIVPTFDTKVTEYLCSGGFFFLRTSFDFLTSHF